MLVRRVHNGVTTVYVGDHAEWRSDTGAWTNYYHFNGQRVAKRNGSNVFWLHGNHPSTSSGQALGSASLPQTAVAGRTVRCDTGRLAANAGRTGPCRLATSLRINALRTAWGYMTTMHACIRLCWHVSSRRTASCQGQVISKPSTATPTSATTR